MTFLCKHFSELSLEQLYAIMAIRQEIFVVEQDCPYLDADGKDQQSYHLMGFNTEGNLLAYSRIVPQGVSYPEFVSIGRVVIAASARKKGMGSLLMEKSIARCQEIFGEKSIKISAQAHLEQFYGALGFVPVGVPYLEDDIPHIGMILQKP